MFAPRFITLLVMLSCTLGAMVLSTNVLVTFPQEWMQYLSVAALSLFATSGLIMFIGTFGMQMTADGVVFMHTNALGRMMESITSNRRHGEELHCCDVYIDTTKRTALFVGIGLVLFGFCMVVYDNPLKFLGFVAAVVGCFVAIAGLLHLLDKRDRKNVPTEEATPAQKKDATKERLQPVLRRLFGAMGTLLFWVIAMFFVAVVLGAIGLLGFAVYMLITELIALGYSPLRAIGFILMPFALACFPLLCIAGKKILLRTGFARELCPTIRR